MNNTKIKKSVIADSSTLHLGKFQKNPSGEYLIIVKDYSDVRNIKIVDEFRCDDYKLCVGRGYSKES